jgi:hypothetical protein
MPSAANGSRYQQVLLEAIQGASLTTILDSCEALAPG